MDPTGKYLCSEIFNGMGWNARESGILETGQVTKTR